MRTVFYLVQKEALQVVRDRVMLFQICAIPIIQLLIVTSAATFEVRQAEVHLVDADRSPASRRVAEAVEASEQFAIAERSTDADAADRSLRTRQTDLILHIPNGFGRELMRQEPPAIRLVVSGTKASAGVVQSYASQILQDVAADYGTQLQAQVQPTANRAQPGDDFQSETTSSHALRALPSVRARIDVRSRLWYNAALDYDDYMAPGILTLLVTLISTLLTAQNIVREQEIGTIEQLNVTPITRGQFIAGKLLPFWGLGLVEFGAGLTVARLVFKIPVRGSLPFLFGATALYLVVALGVGLWISTVADTQQQAMFVTFFVMVIYLFMSGLFTPVASMPAWAEWMAQLSPLKHFIEIVRGVLMKGAGLRALWQPIVILGGYGALVFALAVRQYRKTKA